MCIEENILTQCDDEVLGGLMQTAVGEIEDVQAWTENAGGEVTAVTMKTGKKMWVINWEDETADYKCDPMEAQAGSRSYQVGYTHLIDGMVLGMDGGLAKAIDGYVKCRCGLFVINTYNSGTKLIAGLRYRKSDVVGVPNRLAKFIAKSASASGKTTTTLANFTIKLDAKTIVPYQNFLGTIPLVAAV